MFASASNKPALSSATRAPTGKPAQKPVSRAKTNSTNPDSKQSRIIAMLRAPTGTTIARMMKATGWQQHSVRGFFAGVVRKKLGLRLESEKTDGERVYRIVAGKPSKAKSKADNADRQAV